MTESEAFERVEKTTSHIRSNTENIIEIHICSTSLIIEQPIDDSISNIFGNNYKLIMHVNPAAKHRFSFTAFITHKDPTKSFLEYVLLVPFESFKHPEFHTCFSDISANWKSANNWVAKFYLVDKHQVKLNRNEKKSLAPKGELLVAMYELCERCYSYLVDLKTFPYKSGKNWFSHVITDLLVLDIDKLKYPTTDIEKSFKKGFIEYERNNLRTMKDWKNPFKESSANGLRTLIDSCLYLARIRDDFKKSYWNTFLKAYSYYINEMTKSWNTGYVKDNKFYSRGGRGRNNGEYPMCFGHIDGDKMFDYKKTLETFSQIKFKTRETDQIKYNYYLCYRQDNTFTYLRLWNIAGVNFCDIWRLLHREEIFHNKFSAEDYECISVSGNSNLLP